MDTGKDWVLQLLAKCSEHVRDLVIMTIWRIWQLCNDSTHGKGECTMQATVDYLDSYYKSLNLVNKYSMGGDYKGEDGE